MGRKERRVLIRKKKYPITMLKGKGGGPVFQPGSKGPRGGRYVQKEGTRRTITGRKKRIKERGILEF